LGGIEVALSALLFQTDAGNQPKEGSNKIGIKASAPKNNPNKSIPRGIKVALPTSRSSRKRGVPPKWAITTKAISQNIIGNQPKQLTSHHSLIIHYISHFVSFINR
jgi:hypothetical protein